jgi:sec-independent protein translocase protein TatC
MTELPPSNIDPDQVRMSIGDHLDALRSHLIRGMLGVCVGVVVGIALGKPILEAVCRPVVMILKAHHLDPRLQVLNPQEPFVIWIKIGLFTGLILGGPYLIWEIWRFVAQGLYAREKKLVRKMIPASIVLFASGVLFFFFLVLPLALNFFVSFAGRLTTTSVEPSWLQRMVVGTPETETVTTQPTGPGVPVLPGSPLDPEPGRSWIDSAASELRFSTDEGIFSIPVTLVGEQSMVQSQFRLQEYISFVGMLALSFGIAFQMPVVVVFLAWADIFSAKQMASVRKYVIFGIAIAAAVLTPTPDAMSMTLLAVPMFLLFEGGLVLARLTERRQTKAEEP